MVALELCTTSMLATMVGPALHFGSSLAASETLYTGVHLLRRACFHGEHL